MQSSRPDEPTEQTESGNAVAAERGRKSRVSRKNYGGSMICTCVLSPILTITAAA